MSVVPFSRCVGISKVAFAARLPDKKSSLAHAAETASMRAIIFISKDSMTKGATAYGTNPLIIKPGTQVTWKNDDSVAHTATADDGKWDSGYIQPGKTYSRVFDKPGRYPYYCTLHGKDIMSGAIEVQ